MVIPLPTARIEGAVAEVVLPCADLETTLAFFVERLGFRLDTIAPADDPEAAVISGHGVRLRLDRNRSGPPATLRLLCENPSLLGGDGNPLTAPNGTRVELVEADPPLTLPPLRQDFELSRNDGGATWVVGRAGMRYRDLLPLRQGGRFIASHIHIPDGGPVPDYVHFHKVRFQMIFCRAGWVRVVYEDQGQPFVLEAGDCVLQPPQIRHRVLDSSADLEVIEIACPARHDTIADHTLSLPTVVVDRTRDFGGQRFVRHVATAATWEPGRWPGFEHRDTGIGAATVGLAGARVVRRAATTATGSIAGSVADQRHDAELLFLFVLTGATTLQPRDADHERLGTGDSVALPAGMAHSFTECSADLELLEVSLPHAFTTTPA